MLNLDDEVFWNSSLRFICKQIDLYVEQNEKSNKNNKKVNQGEETTTYRIKHLEDW